MKQLHELRPDGRKLVVKEGEETKLLDLPEVEVLASDIPKKFRDKHLQALGLLHAMGIEYAKAGRTVPITREELEVFGVEKQLIKDLEGFEYLETYLVEMKIDGRNVGGKKVALVSPKGRALVKLFYDAVSEVSQGEQTSADLPTDSPQEESVQG